MPSSGSGPLRRGYERFFEMDADFSHDPKYLPDFFAALDAGADVVPARPRIQRAKQLIEPRRRQLRTRDEASVRELRRRALRAVHEARPRGEFQRGLMCTFNTSRNSPMCAQ